jgi:succinate dehydrogenase / fumarate reductase iron-sulfur subunit
MTANRIVEFSIYRFDPDKDQEPRMQDYQLEIPANTDMMLLDALIQIKDTVDETLSLRRSCKEGVCGSDGMNINGKNGLACVTALSSLKSPITLRPLPGLPVIRDLIVDMTQFYKQYEKVKPYLINDEEPPAKERLQSPEERAKLDGLYVQRRVRRSGGIRINSLDLQDCSQRYDLLLIVVIQRLKND